MRTGITAIGAALVVALLPLLVSADESYKGGWGEWPANYFPARVIALLFDDYQAIDATHHLSMGGWVVGLGTSSSPQLDKTPCTITPGLHDICSAQITSLSCAKAGKSPMACSVDMTYSYWVDEYDCELVVAGQHVPHVCPEIQVQTHGKRVGPRVEPLPSNAPRVGSAVTFYNATSQSIEGISIWYWWPGVQFGLYAPVALDKPLAPGKRVTATLMRSVFGDVKAEGSNTVERTLVYVGDLCAVYGVVVHFDYSHPKEGQLVSTTLPNVDLCQAGDIRIKD